MGLILPQPVKIRPNHISCKHFRGLGYEVKRGEEIVVDASVLPPTSTTKVQLICDDCGVIFIKRFGDYMKCQFKKYNGKTYCRNCVNKGERSGSWNSNLTFEERIALRQSDEYIKFVKRVLARDNYTCQKCGIKENKRMYVHHMNGYRWCVEERTDDTNGVTLCEDCHKNFHSIYGTIHNTKEQFEEWMQKEIEYNPYTNEIYTLPKIYCLDDGTIYKDRNEAAEMIGCNPMSVHDVCKGRTESVFDKHLVFYKDFLDGTYIEKRKEVHLLKVESDKKLKSNKFHNRNSNINREAICLFDGKIYDLLHMSGYPYNIKTIGSIYRACNKKRDSCGKSNGIKIKWMWYTDFQNLSLSEQLQIAEQNKVTLQPNSYLLNLLNNDISIN